MLVLGNRVARMEVDELQRGQVFTVYVMSVCGTHGTITIKRDCEENRRTLYRGPIDYCWKEWRILKENLANEIIKYKEVR